MDNNIAERAFGSIYAAIDEVNLSRPADRKVVKSPQTILFGQGSVLDSLGLVSLLVTVEQQVATDLNQPVTLADEKAFSMRNSPFATVNSLADYVEKLIAEASPHG